AQVALGDRVESGADALADALQRLAARRAVAPAALHLDVRADGAVGLAAQRAEVLLAQRVDHDRLEAEHPADQARRLERAHERARVERDRIEARLQAPRARERLLAPAPRERLVRSMREAPLGVGD